jgi:hypothetical protein
VKAAGSGVRKRHGTNGTYGTNGQRANRIAAIICAFLYSAPLLFLCFIFVLCDQNAPAGTTDAVFDRKSLLQASHLTGPPLPHTLCSVVP